MKQSLFILGLVSIGLLACTPQPNNSEVGAQNVAAQLDVHYQVVSNFENSCESDKGDCFDATLTLTLPFDFNDNQWQIFFSHPRTVLSDTSTLFDIAHINGDLHSLTPTEAFSGFAAGTSLTIPFQAIGQSVTKNDVMPNYIFKHAQSEALVIASTQEVYDKETGFWTLPHVGEFTEKAQWSRTTYDKEPLATAERLYAEYQGFGSTGTVAVNRVIPALKTYQWANERLKLPNGIDISAELTPTESATLENAGYVLSQDGLPLRRMSKKLPAESYEIAITEQQIDITAGDNAGWYYALQTLSLLYDPETASLPIGMAQDSPRYAFRGVHVDVARNYHDKAFLLRLIEQMGMLKLNKLHLHLAEDEAWRLEIPGLPELTQIGGQRCLDLQDKTCLQPQLGAGVDVDSQVNGYLSVDDYKDVLRAAQSHHVEVIPSLDMPGHSRAAIQAMEARYQRFMQQEQPELAMEYMLIDLQDTTQYSSIQHYNDNTINPCIDSAYHFIGKVLGEIKVMHDEAGVPLTRYHIGADETAGAWVESPQCQALMQEEGIAEAKHLTAYFIARVTKMVNEMGVMAGAWSDGLSHVEPLKLGSRIQANLWGLLPSQGHKLAHEMANYGWDAVLSLPDVLYFDFPYMTHPEETGYYWGSRHTSTFQVFQFMPDNLPAHAELFVDYMGNHYTSEDPIPLDPTLGFAGIQAQVWSESLRHETQAEYMLFPRLVAVAERAWHQAGWELPYRPGQAYSSSTGYFSQAHKSAQLEDWQEFVYALSDKIIPRLDASGVFYRLPPAGAIVEGRVLSLNAPWSNLNLEYTTDDGKNWLAYKQPVELQSGTERVGGRTFTQFNERRSQTMWLTVVGSSH